jgi:alpha-beta hydrolase superfamily lysophospholipase
MRARYRPRRQLAFRTGGGERGGTVACPAMTPRDLLTADGVTLAVRDWPLPAGTARRGAALLIHGLGEHAGRYDHVAALLGALGVAARGYDQRGFGRSGGARGAIPHPEALLDDARLAFDALAAEARDAGDVAPPFLIGHSMGGAVASRAATGGWIAPRGLVLSSPALRTRMSALDRMATAAGLRVAPDLAVPHRLPLDRISRDPSVVAAVRADPLCHDRITPRLARFIDGAGAAATADAPRFRVPTLLLLAGDDRLVDPAGARAFAAAMPAGLCTVRELPGHYHEVFNEREPERAAVLALLRDWIDGQLAPRPT